MTTKIECIKLKDTHNIFCNVCNPEDHVKNDKLYELRFRLFNFIQCIVVCDRHADELRQEVFVAQIGMK
jgi:hypothetical protein